LQDLSNFGELNTRERHELRIRVKKLRYGSEYFATLFAHSRGAQRRYGRALEELQDTLGRLNDIAVQQRIAARIIDDGSAGAHASRRMAFAMGSFTAGETAEERVLVARVEVLRRRLAHAPRFWR